jgi:hypothetical protein
MGAALFQLSYLAMAPRPVTRWAGLVGSGGLAPPTSRVSGECSDFGELRASGCGRSRTCKAVKLTRVRAGFRRQSDCASMRGRQADRTPVGLAPRPPVSNRAPARTLPDTGLRSSADLDHPSCDRCLRCSPSRAALGLGQFRDSGLRQVAETSEVHHRLHSHRPAAPASGCSHQG